MMMMMRVSRVCLLYVSLISKRRDNRDTVTDCASMAGNVVPKSGDLLHLLSIHSKPPRLRNAYDLHAIPLITNASLMFKQHESYARP